MAKIGKLAPLMFLFIIFLGFQSRAEITVQSVVDTNELGVGENFTLSVTVSSDQSVPVNEPSLPVISGVEMVRKWSSNQTKSSVVSTGQGIDFKTIQTKVFSYQFTVVEKGKINIDPIKVQVGGKQYATKPISLRVLDASKIAQGPQRRRRPSPFGNQPQSPSNNFDRLEEQFNQLLKRSFGQLDDDGFMTEPRNAKEAFFILAKVDKTEAFKGEQVLASWYLYTKGRVRDLDTLKYPSLKGFWKEDIQISTHLNFENDVINGIAYKRALLASYALFPIDEGKVNVDSYKAKATIVGGYGFGRGFSATKASENIPIKIKPLPAEGRPKHFTGAVGEFQMKVEVADKSVVANQPFALKIRFEGKGNAKLIELPALNLENHFEVYDVKNESKFFKNGQSYKDFEVLLIPRQAGDLTIPPMENSFFDPRQEKYVSLTSEPIQIKVLPGGKQLSMGEERLESPQEEVPTLPQPTQQWDPEFKAAGSNFILWMIAFGGLFLLLVGRTLYELGVFQRNPDLKDVVKGRFQKIDHLVAKNKYRQVGIEVTNTVYEVLGDVSGEGGANEELNKILKKTAPSVRREIEAPLSKLMDYFGILGFGPKSFIEKIDDNKEVKLKVKEMEKLLFRAISLNRGSETMEEAN